MLQLNCRDRLRRLGLLLLLLLLNRILNPLIMRDVIARLMELSVNVHWLLHALDMRQLMRWVLLMCPRLKNLVDAMLAKVRLLWYLVVHILRITVADLLVDRHRTWRHHRNRLLQHVLSLLIVGSAVWLIVGLEDPLSAVSSLFQLPSRLICLVPAFSFISLVLPFGLVFLFAIFPKGKHRLKPLWYFNPIIP